MRTNSFDLYKRLFEFKIELKRDPDRWAHSNREVALLAAAQYGKLPQTHWHLHKHPNPQVRKTLASNPKVSNNILGRLADDRQDSVRIAAIDALDYRKDKRDRAKDFMGWCSP